MRITVISDTHLNGPGQWIPRPVEDSIIDTGYFVHCGDFASVYAYEKMNALARMEAVCGNMDPPAVRQVLPAKTVFNVAGYKVGVIHGFGSPRGIENRVAQQFQKKVDVILFGHSHRPFHEIINGVLLFNPGSPTDKRFAPYCSFGLIEFGAKGINAKICELK